MDLSTIDDPTVLRTRITELERENEMLRVIASSSHFVIRSKFTLTEGETKILVRLMDGNAHDIYELASLIASRGQGNPSSARVEIFRLRKKIAPIEIKVLWGRGYRMEPEQIDAVVQAIGGLND